MNRWQELLKSNFRDLKKLISFLELDLENQKELLEKTSFPLNLPLRLAQKIQKNTLNDPILKQFIPLQKEEIKNPSFIKDPVQDGSFTDGKKLLHKYHNRALLLVSSFCAMNCRYCFRKNFPYEKEEPGYENELEKIRNNPNLNEIILSGGDPLSLSDQGLEKLLSSLDQIPHIKRIRFHTRFPVGIPERISDSFLSILSKISKQIYFVIHVNHPKELDPDILASLKRVQKLGIVLLSQSVLLKDINDDIETMTILFNTLSDHGIIPYYLHQLDPVEGATHYLVEEEKGIDLLQALKKTLSGYSLPRYVKEVPFEKSKTTIL